MRRNATIGCASVVVLAGVIACVDPEVARVVPAEQDIVHDDYPLPHTTRDTILEDAADGWKNLVLTDWKLDGGRETDLCVTVTVPAKTYISAFKAVGTLGTHHATLNTASDMSDGVTEHCLAVVMYPQIFASGTTELTQTMPDGVAMKLEAGAQVVLRLHLFNPRDDVLEGHSGVLVRTTRAADVDEVAGSVLAGTVGFVVPPGVSTQTGSCTLRGAVTVFNVFPHMHQLGRSMKAVVVRAGGGEKVLYDGPFAFDEQLRYDIDPVRLQLEDYVRVECTYDNTRGANVGFGYSRLDEMCFLGLSSYPPILDTALCVD